MSDDAQLASVPVEQWQTRQAVIFDWYDGPREGVCALDNPNVEFVFTLLAERPTDAGLDDRLFALSAIPPGSVAALVEQLRTQGVPNTSLWVPLWRFPSRAEQREADEYVVRLRAGARPLAVVISTPDMSHFHGCWKIDPRSHNVNDWFAVVESLAQPAH